MDGVSLGISVAGFVLQAYSAVVGCLEAIRNFRDAGDKNATLNCKLQIEQYNLMAWGRDCGLMDGMLSQHVPSEEGQAIALIILRRMLGIVAETEALRSNYGLNFFSADGVDTSSNEQTTFGIFLNTQNKLPISNFTSTLMISDHQNGLPSVIADATVAYTKSIEKGKTAMKFMRKCRWIVTDSKRFEEMIKELRYFNQSLDRLVTSRPSLGLTTMESEIMFVTPEGSLPALESAASNTYPTLSIAANLKIRVTQLEPASTGSRGIPTTMTAGPLRTMSIELRQLDMRPVPESGSRSRTLATYQPERGQSRDVLVEIRKFESELTRFTRNATIKRAEALARILQKQPNDNATDVFRTLKCVGYFITDQQVGYVFDLPPETNSSHQPVSLWHLLYGDDSEDYMDKPPLESRLALSKALCKSVYYLHLGELVHKGIRSDNILFFRKEGESAIRIVEPFITGFDHSRPDGPDDPTMTKAATGPDEDRYRHPEYHMTVSRRSTKIHDLYSLGLVLLEVAHWVKLKDLVLHKTGEEVRAYLVSDESPIEELDHLVGTRYQSAVYRCIRGQFRVDVSAENAKGALQRIFLDEIVSEIMKCSV